MSLTGYLWCLQRDLHEILHEGGPSDQEAWKIGYPVTVRDYLWQYSNLIDLDPREGQQT